MKIIPKLNLNQNPQDCEEGSLVFAKNVKVDCDNTIITDYGYLRLNFNELKTANIVGHIVGLDNCIYLFLATHEIYEYNEDTNSIKKLQCVWYYSGGKIDGCVTTNISGEKILTIAESDANTDVPLKHINLTYSASSRYETIYSQAPKIPLANLILQDTYSNTIPNGVYVFFIRYRIRKDVYTNWFLCSRPIFAGTSDVTTTIQGGVKSVNPNKDSAKSFKFELKFINAGNRGLYDECQLGFIITHDDATNARIWKSFKMSSVTANYIYFDYNDVKEANIDDMLASTYELYNVKNITTFKNKLYISNYKESDFNPNSNSDEIKNLLSNIDIKISARGNISPTIKTIKYYGNNLAYDVNNKYYKFSKDHDNINREDIVFKFTDFYKEREYTKEGIVTFNTKTHYKEDDATLCSVYNIRNNAYNKSNTVFGNDFTEEFDYDYGLQITDGSVGSTNIKIVRLNPSYVHPWHNKNLTYSYFCIKGAIENEQVTIVPVNSKRLPDTSAVINGRPYVWINDISKKYIIDSIKEEISNLNTIYFTQIEVIYGGQTYIISSVNKMNIDTYIGDDDHDDLRTTNIDNSDINLDLTDKILYWLSSYDIKGIDEYGNLVALVNNNYLKFSSVKIRCRKVEFTVKQEELENDNTNFSLQWTVDAKITDYAKICSFKFVDGKITVSNNIYDSKQGTTLMPYQVYDAYIHFVDEHGIITNGYLKTNIERRDGLFDSIYLQYKVNANISTINTKYVAFFISLYNKGNFVVQCFDLHSLGGNKWVVSCLEADALLYNLNNNIVIIDDEDNIITSNGTYYSSGESNPALAFGNCGFIMFESSYLSGNESLFINITNRTDDSNPALYKATEYIPLARTIDEDENDYVQPEDGFYGSYNCIVKKPSFDLSSSCYVSGNDIYSIDRDNSLTVTDFKEYIQLLDSPTFRIKSNFNLNYLSLTEDINEQIFSVGKASSGIKQLVRTINSANLSYIYELKNMYKNFRNKTFRVADINKINFDNTIRVSNVLTDESFNNSVYKFKSTDYYHIPADRGIIVKLFSIGNNIFVHTKGSLYKFDGSQNIVATNSDIALQESDPFDNGITQIFDSQYGYAGLDNKESGCITFDSYVFFDKITKHIFAYGGQSQIQTIDKDIYKTLQHYNITTARLIHDETNNRILINFVLDSDKEITLSYNYIIKAFVSLHDMTLKNAFNSRSKCYSYNNDGATSDVNNSKFYRLFDNNYVSGTISDRRYGNATKQSYLTDAEKNSTYKNCQSSISVILFPNDNQRDCLNSVQYIADMIKANIISPDSTYDLLDIARNTKENPVKEFFATTDECKSTSVITNTNDEARPNSMLDYQGFKYNLGFWTSNYFRNKLNVENVYKYSNQPGVDVPIPNAEKPTTTVTRIPNVDNYSLVYGRYFILTFGFVNKPIKFENVLINSSQY